MANEAGGNGANDWRHDLQERMQALENAQRRAESALAIVTEVASTLAEVARDHQKRLAEHEAILKHIEIGLAEASDKLNALIDREMRREGGPESRI
jgi:hypothetical protein